MKAVILCAGQGLRLRPLTNDRPKGMVEVGGKSLLERQLELFRAVGIDNIVVVGGYCHNTLPSAGITKRINDEFETTNMVYSLFCAEQDLLGEDSVIISYGDIMYSKRVLDAVIAAPSSFNVVVDLDWYDYFSQRSDDVLSDAESLTLEDGRITNIGATANSIEEIQGQYIGLMKFDRAAIESISKIYHESLTDGSSIGWGRPIRSAYLTDLLQECVNRGADVHSVPIHGEWCEIDTPHDHELAEAMCRTIDG